MALSRCIRLTLTITVASEHDSMWLKPFAIFTSMKITFHHLIKVFSFKSLKLWILRFFVHFTPSKTKTYYFLLRTHRHSSKSILYCSEHYFCYQVCYKTISLHFLVMVALQYHKWASLWSQMSQLLWYLSWSMDFRCLIGIIKILSKFSYFQ